MKLRCCHLNQRLWSDRGIRSAVTQHSTSHLVWGQKRSKMLCCIWKKTLAWAKNKLLSPVAHSKQCTYLEDVMSAWLSWGLWWVYSRSFASSSQQTIVPVFVLWVPEGTGHFTALKRTALKVPQRLHCNWSKPSFWGMSSKTGLCFNSWIITFQHKYCTLRAGSQRASSSTVRDWIPTLR